MKYVNHLYLIILVFVTFWNVQPVTGIEKDPVKTGKVLILPFQIHSPKDMSYLREGIEDMLASRLGSDASLVAMNRSLAQKIAENGPKYLNESNLPELVRGLGADYVVFGSVTLFGGSISTDARFYDVSDGKILVVFHASGKNHGDVIDHMNRFSEQIQKKLFGTGEKIAGQEEAPRGERIDAGKPAGKPPVPQKKEPADGTPEIPTPLPIKQKPPSGISSGEFWKSKTFDMQLKGLSLGDVDGDGKMETVLLEGNRLAVYRFTNGTFQKIAERRLSSSGEVLGLDTGDINGNGLEEVFVTMVRGEKNIPVSQVMEWDGTRFSLIEKKARWYFRVIDIPGRGKVLHGQKNSMDGKFAPAIHELKWENGKYVSNKVLSIPRNVNIFGFSMGDALNEDQSVCMYYDGSDYLRIVDREEKLVWKSGEEYGGNTLFIEYPQEGAARISGEPEKSRTYIPQRILVRDVDGDGLNDIIVSHNKEMARRTFARFRMFSNGNIQVLFWKNGGISSKWKTQDFSGYVSDFSLGDFDNDGGIELVFTVVVQQESILGKARSYIAVQEIP